MRLYYLMIPALGLLAGCGGSDGSDGSAGPAGEPGIDSLVTVSAEAPGANCAIGGQRIEQGPDSNRNGTLDPDEISSTSYVCNGADGTDGQDGAEALVNLVPEPAGANCVAGGTLVQSGVDDNGDGILDGAEVDTEDYVCDGQDGSAGTDGLTALVDIQTEPAGANCAEGGQVIRSGLDDDVSGTLEAGEVDATSYVCDGADGTSGSGQNALVAVSDEPVGANCASGGQRIDSGLDSDGDGILDAGEVTDTAYVCHLQPDVLVSTVEDPTICLHGGVIVQIGYDDNTNGVLDSGEITSTDQVCTGNQAPTLVLGDTLPEANPDFPVQLAGDGTIELIGGAGSALANPFPSTGFYTRFLAEGVDYMDGSQANDFLWKPAYVFRAADEEGDPVNASLQGAPAWLSVEVITETDGRVAAEELPQPSEFPLVHLSGQIPAGTAGVYDFELWLTDGEKTEIQPVRLTVQDFGPRLYTYGTGAIAESNGSIVADSTGLILPFLTYPGMSVTGSGSTGVSKSVLAKFPLDGSFTPVLETESGSGDYGGDVSLFDADWGVWNSGPVANYRASEFAEDWDGDGSTESIEAAFGLVAPPYGLLRDSAANAYFFGLNSTATGTLNDGDLIRGTAGSLDVWSVPAMFPLAIAADGSALLARCASSSDGDAHADISTFCLASVDTANGNVNWQQTDLDGVIGTGAFDPGSTGNWTRTGGAFLPNGKQLIGLTDTTQTIMVQVDGATGAVDWAVPMPANPQSIRVASNNDVLVLTYSDIQRYSGTDGSLLWTQPYTRTSRQSGGSVRLHPLSSGGFVLAETPATPVVPPFMQNAGAGGPLSSFNEEFRTDSGSLKRFDATGTKLQEQRAFFEFVTLAGGNLTTVLRTGQGTFLMEQFDPDTLARQ
jgi:hypothetical protein